MRDTIDLLEAIGSDASLRHASAAHLIPELEKAGATEALKQSVTARDGSALSSEFGVRAMHTLQMTQGPAHEGDHEDDHDDDHDHDHKHDDDRDRPAPGKEKHPEDDGSSTSG